MEMRNLSAFCRLPGVRAARMNIGQYHQYRISALRAPAVLAGACHAAGCKRPAGFIFHPRRYEKGLLCRGINIIACALWLGKRQHQNQDNRNRAYAWLRRCHHAAHSNEALGSARPSRCFLRASVAPVILSVEIIRNRMSAEKAHVMSALISSSKRSS